VHLDAMGFGMGCCCLQCTFQASDINEARFLYDQFAVLSPVMLALSAACPIARGYLVDTDVRWHIIAGAVDDRTPEERDSQVLIASTLHVPQPFQRPPTSNATQSYTYIFLCCTRINDVRPRI
jgi:glutamate--cysteine ligase catalytic subunit